MEPLRWLELRVHPGAHDPALVVEALLSVGGRAVTEEEGWHVSHLPEPSDGADGVESCILQLRAYLGDDELEVEHRWQAQEDWGEYWKRGLEVRRLTPRLLVRPSWLQAETRPDDVVLVLDPGMAFGNAEHGTTRGCLRILDEAVRSGDRILDVGTGSGVLAIAAAGLGAREVTAVEADEMAVPTARENLHRNGVEDRVRLDHRRVAPSDLEPGGDYAGPYHGVMANLETGRLLPLMGGLLSAVAPGGWLLVSGILAEEWPDVVRAVTRMGGRLERTDADGVWRSGLFVKPQGAPGNGA